MSYRRPPALSSEEIDKLRTKLESLLQHETLFKLRSDFHDACDLDVGLGELGSITLCLRERQWCPGGSSHARWLHPDAPEWFGVQVRGERYLGRGWLERMAEDIQEVAKRLIHAELIERSPHGQGRFLEFLQGVQASLGLPDETWRKDYEARRAARAS